MLATECSTKKDQQRRMRRSFYRTWSVLFAVPSPVQLSDGNKGSLTVSPFDPHRRRSMLIAPVSGVPVRHLVEQIGNQHVRGNIHADVH